MRAQSLLINNNSCLRGFFTTNRCCLLIAMSVMLSACGGGGGDSPSRNTGMESLIVGGVTGNDATGASTEQLQQMAASRAGAGLGVNLSNLSRLSDDSQVNLSNTALTDLGLSNISVSNDSNELDTLDSENINFLNSTLGVQDPGATTQRDGNIITINPDDQRVCGNEVPLASTFNDDQSICQQLVADLIVEIDARSDESGIITYLFQDSPVLLVGYSPMGASYEVNLGGLRLVAIRSDELNGVDTSNFPILSGALRLAATIINNEAGSEAGEISLTVSETLQVGESDSDLGLTLQPSTVFELALNEGTGDVSMGVNWGALQIITESGDSEGNSSIETLNLGGLSGQLSVNEDQPTFQISNVGIGNVPLNITIDSVESVNLSLANFGVTVDRETGMVTLDGALNASFMLNNMMGLLEDRSRNLTASATVSAPASTSFVEQSNGSTLLSTGGPLTATIIASDELSNTQSEIMINAGDCFSSTAESDNAISAVSDVVTVPCN